MNSGKFSVKHLSGGIRNLVFLILTKSEHVLFVIELKSHDIDFI